MSFIPSLPVPLIYLLIRQFFLSLWPLLHLLAHFEHQWILSNHILNGEPSFLSWRQTALLISLGYLSVATSQLVSVVVCKGHFNVLSCWVLNSYLFWVLLALAFTLAYWNMILLRCIALMSWNDYVVIHLLWREMSILILAISSNRHLWRTIWWTGWISKLICPQILWESLLRCWYLIVLELTICCLTLGSRRKVCGGRVMCSISVI